MDAMYGLTAKYSRNTVHNTTLTAHDTAIVIVSGLKMCVNGSTAVYVLGLLGVCMIAVWPWTKDIEYDIWGVHYQDCKERFDRNALFLGSDLCDKSKNELLFKDLAKCDKARRQNAWGIKLCAIRSRLGTSDVTDILTYVRDSWAIYAFFMICAVAGLRYYLQGRAEIAKHTKTLEVQERLQRSLLNNFPYAQQGEIDFNGDVAHVRRLNERGRYRIVPKRITGK